MNITTIEPRMLRGTVQVPPSKSVAHRAIIAAALSGEPCCIENIALSKDIRATLGCMRSLGAVFQEEIENGRILFGRGRKDNLEDELVLDCEESGSTLRFLIPVALLQNRPAVFRGKGRLMQRPQKPYFDLFDKARISYQTNEDSIRIAGRLKPGIFKLPGNVSSQFVSGLLFALPLLPKASTIEITTEMESKGYVDLTLSVLENFGIRVENENYRCFKIPGGQRYQGKNYRVEGDYSQAAFFLAAGALGCDVRCRGLRPDSLQGDKKILDILTQIGAKLKMFSDGSVQAYPTANMHGVVIDAREIPDLVPILAVLCAFCKGESRIINAGRLRMKESDRLAAVSSELSRLGLTVEEGTDSLTIFGQQTLYGETVSAWNDHRIAMALAIAACRCEGVVSITGAAEAVTKSYPDFFQVYQRLQTGPESLLEFDRTITHQKEGRNEV